MSGALDLRSLLMYGCPLTQIVAWDHAIREDRRARLEAVTS